MKYIRTKDGIWLFGGTHADGKVIIGKKHETDFGFCFEKDDAIKKADTIEDLCDELILKDLDTEMCFTMSAVHIQDIRDNWKNLVNNDYLKNHTIYGAIWTNKGLIYVAKMNDRGELELL